jgi:TatD DNase family protein
LSTSRLPDCHAHLDQFGKRVPDLLKEWEEAGVSPVLSAGMDLDTSQAAIELGWQLRNIKAAVGLHPWKIDDSYSGLADLKEFGAIASDPMVVAVSEVGLDTVSTQTPLAIQGEVLAWFVELAQERGFPVVLHLAAPVDELLNVWESIAGRRPAGAVHSFAGSAQDVERLLERGFYLSLGPSSLGMVGKETLADEVVRQIPAEKLLVDSDAYPASEEWPEVRPAFVTDVVRRVAGIRGEDAERLVEQVAHNFAQLLKNQ